MVVVFIGFLQQFRNLAERPNDLPNHARDRRVVVLQSVAWKHSIQILPTRNTRETCTTNINCSCSFPIWDSFIQKLAYRHRMQFALFSPLLSLQNKGWHCTDFHGNLDVLDLNLNDYEQTNYKWVRYVYTNGELRCAREKCARLAAVPSLSLHAVLFPEGMAG